MDHCEDKLTTADDFSTIADPGAGAIADTVLQAFYCAVRGTIQRRHKCRLTISQVCIYLARLLTLYYTDILRRFLITGRTVEIFIVFCKYIRMRISYRMHVRLSSLSTRKDRDGR